eukprot:NODE_233_length_12044_cov_0.738803.p10 type:complete len:100 gc:universal NODE_233_length_12044_cov_0.738803:2971-2672(-)
MNLIYSKMCDLIIIILLKISYLLKNILSKKANQSNLQSLVINFFVDPCSPGIEELGRMVWITLNIMIEVIYNRVSMRKSNNDMSNLLEAVRKTSKISRI